MDNHRPSKKNAPLAGRMIIYLETLGCAKNLVDSEVMLGYLSRSGYRFTTVPEEAEIIIINTCAFIKEATRESIDTILQVAELKQHGSCRQLVVCGCLPQRYGRELLQALPEVDLFLGTGELQNIATYLRRLSAGQKPPRLRAAKRSFLMNAKTPRVLSTAGASAYIKIAEGCSHHCTYCTIPGIRGPYQGRPAGSVVAEARQLARKGIREINLISQDTGQYDNLSSLLRRLAAIPDIAWIRILYCHPRNLDRETIAVLAGEEKVCKYIDLPLQHIADSVLKRMGRHMTRKQTERLLARIRKASPETAVRTTFMVGFPGESKRDFEELLRFAEEIRFDHMGVFRYRDESGTPASRMSGSVPEQIKNERFHRLMRLQAAVSKEKNRARKGALLEVLVEGTQPRPPYRYQARTRFQAPEVDGVVLLRDAAVPGSFQNVRITRTFTYDLAGSPENEKT